MTARILVVEDSPVQAELLQADLVAAGFDVTVARSGEEALDCLSSETVDLVLSDVVMPGIDGYELCRRLKDAHADLPIVLLTSLGDPTEIVRGLEAGADNFLRKPYDPEHLVSRVHTILYHREMRASGRAVMGLEVVLRGRRFLITAERQQILDLLISSFEDLVTLNHDLTQRETALRATQGRLEEQLVETDRERRRIEAVLDAVPHAIVILDPEGTISDANGQLCALLGLTKADLVGGPEAQCLPFLDATGQPLPFPARPTTAALATGEVAELGARYDLFARRSDGSVVPVIARAAPVRDEGGKLIALVTALHDIGTLAAHDRLTRLPNHALFTDRVARGLESCARSGRRAAVVALVLHHLGRLRDRLAPEDADLLLARAAERLRQCVADPTVGGSAGSAAYLGGDLFGVVLLDLEDDLDAVRRAQALGERLVEDPETVAGVAVAKSVTVGIALDGGGKSEPVELVTAAVTAARRATGTGDVRLQVADPAVDARAGDWLRREAELRAAIAAGEIVAHFQPEVDLRTGRPTGVEALARWEHPDRGTLPPAHFLELAYDTGLIADLGWRVLEDACRHVAAWRSGGVPGASTMTVAVNFDASQLADAHAAHRVREILERTGLAADALVVEITEHGVTEDVEVAAERLRELKALGLRVAIDDFGTGYSSLAQLRRFPVDFLKIDRSFVGGMVVERDDAAIVAATVRLARALGLDTIAEGVETEGQVVQLRVLGCDLAQGYLWAPPMAPAELEEWWRAHPTGPELATAARPTREDDADSAIDEAVAFLTHELRSPLAVIAGYARLALEQGGDDMSRVLTPIVRSAGDLDRRISMLSDMRAASVGAMHLDVEKVDVVEVVRTLVDDLAAQLEPHDVTVHGEGPVWAAVDVSRLVQAVTNLVTNAAKFSPPDAPIDLHVVERDGVAEVAVEDRGPGIPAERRPELFRRFARLGARTTGMGIGLYLVRAIARAHGGDARHEPRPGGGSRFLVTVPSAAGGLRAPARH